MRAMGLHTAPLSPSTSLPSRVHVPSDMLRTHAHVTATHHLLTKRRTTTYGQPPLPQKKKGKGRDAFRGLVMLPHPYWSGKTICVFARGDDADAAKAAGACCVCVRVWVWVCVGVRTPTPPREHVQPITHGTAYAMYLKHHLPLPLALCPPLSICLSLACTVNLAAMYPPPLVRILTLTLTRTLTLPLPLPSNPAHMRPTRSAPLQVLLLSESESWSKSW
jgi:hypothetical protein